MEDWSTSEEPDEWEASETEEDDEDGEGLGVDERGVNQSGWNVDTPQPSNVSTGLRRNEGNATTLVVPLFFLRYLFCCRTMCSLQHLWNIQYRPRTSWWRWHTWNSVHKV